MHSAVIFCIILSSLIKYNFGLEYNKQQRYNTNTDFLLHEGEVYPNGPSKDGQAVTAATSSLQNINQNNGKRDYVAQFPALKPASTSQSTTAGTSTSVSQNSGKRDYVAPQYPQVSTQSTSKPSTIGSINAHSPPNQNGGKRDYVAPQHTTPRPVQGNNQPHTNTKVKDLINYYDNKNTGQNGAQKIPSYSSILQGNTNKNKPGSTSTTSLWTQSTQRPSVPNKPLSFSNVVSGSKSPNSPTPPSRGPGTQHVRPGNPVLPSTIVNNNKNNQISSNEATDADLQTLSEELLRKDVNNAAKFITINYQEKTSSHSNEDKAPGPLLTVGSEVWSIPTIQTFVPLLDNYERDTLLNEHVTPQERTEENAFMDAIMSTTVIRHLMTFFKNKGYVTSDPRQQRDFLKQLWFGLYSRGKGKISSSGFEHIFVSELKNGQVSGLHNWIYFSKEEAANRINYLGYLKYVELSDKGAVLKLHFNQQGIDKPVDSMFVGTSPELEIALYTLCFVTRVDTECKLKLANKDIEIITHKFRYRSKDYIGSGYPQIPFSAN